MARGTRVGLDDNHLAVSRRGRNIEQIRSCFGENGGQGQVSIDNNKQLQRHTICKKTGFCWEEHKRRLCPAFSLSPFTPSFFMICCRCFVCAPQRTVQFPHKRRAPYLPSFKLTRTNESKHACWYFCMCFHFFFYFCPRPDTLLLHLSTFVLFRTFYVMFHSTISPLCFFFCCFSFVFFRRVPLLLHHNHKAIDSQSRLNPWHAVWSKNKKHKKKKRKKKDKKTKKMKKQTYQPTESA